MEKKINFSVILDAMRNFETLGLKLDDHLGIPDSIT
jgi:hypothetical protein